jgi:hypothetical protein
VASVQSQRDVSVVWRATLRRGRAVSAGGRDGARPSTTACQYYGTPFTSDTTTANSPSTNSPWFSARAYRAAYTDRGSGLSHSLMPFARSQSAVSPMIW